MAKKSEYVSRDEAAEILGVTVRTIDRLTERGVLHAYRSKIGIGRGGRRILFERAEVERLRDEPPDREE